MEERTIKKLAKQTEKMYTSVMGQIKNGYYALWSPRIEELNMIMEALVSDYERCEKGSITKEQYETFSKWKEECLMLEDVVFVQGELDRMLTVQKNLSQIFTEAREVLERGIMKYELVENRISEVYVYEKEFITASSNLISDYKARLRNRIRHNISKVIQFETFSEEERKHFMTHVLMFDEGKLENTIREHLNEAEQKVVEDFFKVEQRAIIYDNMFSEEECHEYIRRFREETKRKNPLEFSISKKLLKEGELEDKFELWFNSLIGNDSSVGKLINEEKKSFDLPIEERMFQAIEGVIDANMGNLHMTELIDAYKEESALLKEKSFKEFYGNYEEIKNLICILEKAEIIFPRWDTSEVGLGDIILGKY